MNNCKTAEYQIGIRSNTNEEAILDKSVEIAPSCVLKSSFSERG